MFGNLETFDLVTFFGYLLLMMGFGVWIANREKTENSSDYFLASRALPWWAVGGSLIASNISTEQIMGMNGSGFEFGLAIATYELMAAASLLIVAKFFLPVFLKKGIFTMPQFLEMRYDKRSATLMSVLWLALFIFVNITSVLYLGGLAIESLLGVPLWVGIAGLVIYSATFSIFGGLKAVVWTDVIQVIVLVVGGTVAAYAVITAVNGGGLLDGIATLMERTPERFEMLFEPDDTFTSLVDGPGQSSYKLLPGLGVLFGGMWITNLYYWGNNQYIIQRALAAKNISEAQKGVAFAAFLKLFMPLIVVLPGIAAFVLNADLEKADQAFPWVLNNYVGVGLKGLTFAALVAAIGSSISSIVNSCSTIFTLDIYHDYVNTAASEQRLVWVGRVSAAVALAIGAVLAPFLDSFGQVIQFIQDFTGYISPGVFAVFIFGMFWKRTTANAAFVTILLALPITFALEWLLPFLPFIDRMAICFAACVILLVGVSIFEAKNETNTVNDRPFRYGLMGAIALIAGSTGLKILFVDYNVANWIGILCLVLAAIAVALIATEKKADDIRAIHLEKGMFRTGAVFNVSALAICLILAAIYSFLG